ncbi:MAG: hypothetical protein M1829_002025 [Trizodia sp. TS-e1964]|nr:MAG: hypothetical protein M1829_002025 [Trizodia sp. TS-e1964]
MNLLTRNARTTIQQFVNRASTSPNGQSTTTQSNEFSPGDCPNSSLKPRTRRRINEKRISQRESHQKLFQQGFRRKLEGASRGAVQCAGIVLMNRLHELGHPRKVSMKKKKEKRKDLGGGRV